MRTDNPLAPAGVKEPSVPPPPLDQHVYAGGKEYSQQHHHGGKAVETAQPSEFAQASGRIVAAHPCCSLATIGLAMVALVALGQAVTPLQFDSSVDGFAPRGTPVATRLNTGFLLQGAMEADKKGLGADSLPDGLLRGYPLADCDEPPVEVWMALCSDGAGPVPGGGGGAVAAAASAAGISRLVSSLSSSCNPICRAAVAPWARECRERLGWPNNALMDVVATTVLSKLPGGELPPTLPPPSAQRAPKPAVRTHGDIVSGLCDHACSCRARARARAHARARAGCLSLRFGYHERAAGHAAGLWVHEQLGHPAGDGRVRGPDGGGV
eukprot:COSAG01_NODE_708_length_14125_cov_3.872745_6_plen_325_part_00